MRAQIATEAATIAVAVRGNGAGYLSERARRTAAGPQSTRFRPMVAGRNLSEGTQIANEGRTETVAVREDGEAFVRMRAAGGNRAVTDAVAPDVAAGHSSERTRTAEESGRNQGDRYSRCRPRHLSECAWRAGVGASSTRLRPMTIGRVFVRTHAKRERGSNRDGCRPRGWAEAFVRMRAAGGKPGATDAVAHVATGRVFVRTYAHCGEEQPRSGRSLRRRPGHSSERARSRAHRAHRPRRCYSGREAEETSPCPSPPSNARSKPSW